MLQTLEQAAQSYLDRTYNLSYERNTWQKLHEKTFIAGADFQAQTMYSEADMRTAISIAYCKGLAKPNSGRLSDIPNVQHDILLQLKNK